MRLCLESSESSSAAGTVLRSLAGDRSTSTWTSWALLLDVAGAGMDTDVSARATGAAASHSGEVTRRAPNCSDNKGAGVLAPGLHRNGLFCDEGH